MDICVSCENLPLTSFAIISHRDNNTPNLDPRFTRLPTAELGKNKQDTDIYNLALDCWPVFHVSEDKSKLSHIHTSLTCIKTTFKICRYIHWLQWWVGTVYIHWLKTTWVQDKTRKCRFLESNKNNNEGEEKLNVSDKRPTILKTK